MTQSIEPVSGETKLLPCPFCGSNDIDPEGWATSAGICGPACNGCQASVGSALSSTADNIAAWNRRTLSPAHGEAVDAYDAGLLNDYGGGNVDWWQDYIRAELGRAHDHYMAQFAGLSPDRLPLGVKAWVADYRKSDGTTDHYVMIGNDGREMSLHMHAVRGRAEYEAAEINHVLTGSPNPDFDDFDLDGPTALTPIEPTPSLQNNQSGGNIEHERVSEAMVERASRALAGHLFDHVLEGDAESEWHRLADVVRLALEAALNGAVQ